MGFFADDATIVASVPFAGAGEYRGRAQIRSFVAEHLAREVRLDLTKKLVAHNGVAWTVSVPAADGPANRVEGVAEAEFRGREIKHLRLGAGT